MTEYNRSANKLQDEAEEVRTRLEKERRAVAASQEEAAAARKAQEQEKREAKEKLEQVEAELQRERENKNAAEASKQQEKDNKTIQAAKAEAAKADQERERIDREKTEAEAKWRAADARAEAAEAEVAEARGRLERDVAEARVQAAAAAVEENANRITDGGLARLQTELAVKVSELRLQTDKALSLEAQKERAEVAAVKRERSLQDLMEKNRARYEKANLELQEEVEALSQLKDAAAGFEDAKIKLELADKKSAELEKEASSLKEKMTGLDKKLAASVDKSVEEALLLVSKEAALKDVEAQLTAVKDRAKVLEKEALRVPELEEELKDQSEVAQKEKRRADELQAIQDKEEAQTELVKERLFDLERSVEMAEWSERKLAKENEGLQGLISRNRQRFHKELARLTVASADLEDKSNALKDLEAVYDRERQTVKELGNQVETLKAKAEELAAELSMTRDELARETEMRLKAETAVEELQLAEKADKGYEEQLKKADAALQAARQEGQAAVAEVQTLLEKEKQAWGTEKSSLTTRLEEALRSTEDFSARVVALESSTEKLRQESQQSKAEAEQLRTQLGLSAKSLSEATVDKERLVTELEKTKGVVEERNRLQKSVDNLKAALKKFTGKQDDESDNNGATLEKEAEVDALEQAQERLSKTAATLSGEESRDD
ncbi:expressed unknown protein [Ectocarpus siliculosus]|uniref:Uncharacterized protein n=1 Tax=Ectocarpus siliculosus TaxID=2880 RepID=D8LH17_ECTSI|nr:expressed unknown protein [Ectocarpus siliculosus]|eukprot:CBN75870.1 expressed unknown protein [Ectocarpus siliculosus]